jgi:hypothetical protein
MIIAKSPPFLIAHGPKVVAIEAGFRVCDGWRRD